jgi:hypothetical protein
MCVYVYVSMYVMMHIMKITKKQGPPNYTKLESRVIH